MARPRLSRRDSRFSAGKPARAEAPERRFAFGRSAGKPTCTEPTWKELADLASCGPDFLYDLERGLEGGIATHLPYAQRTIETRGVNLHTYFAGHFIDFGERFGVAAKAVEARLNRMTSRAAPFTSRVAEIGLDARRTKQLPG